MKKIIYGIAVLAVVGVVAFNVNLETKKSGEVSLMALANIEALADGENGNAGWFWCPGVGFACMWNIPTNPQWSAWAQN
jgi:hypothetical protein